MEGSIEQEGEGGNDVEKGTGQTKSASNKPRGWKTMPYIMGNETFEKLASMSMIANLVVYLRTQYNFDNITAVNIYNIWSGSCNISPLLGAYLSDAYIGKFRTLIFGSLFSTIGMVVLTITAAIRELRPPLCLLGMECKQATGWQLSVLFTGLGLLVIGAGGIRPCNIAFGVDQFDATTEKGKRYIESFYNWYYLSFTIALLIALTVVVYIQNSVSWALGLAIPAGFMLLSVIVFICGSRLYVYIKPKGSVFVSMAKAAVAAYRKRRLTGMEYTLYDAPVDSANTVVKMVHTERFKCFDKAAIITDRDVFDEKGKPVNEWRLCNIEQVEHLKSVISIMPVWISGITSFIIIDQQNSFGVQQAMQLDTHFIGKFEVPPGSLGLTSMIAMAIYIPIYQRFILPMSRKFTKTGINLQDRMRAGILMSILCMLTSGFIEGKRREGALKYGSFKAPMSFAWLLPQFAFSGLTEALMGIALMEFFNVQLPQSMRTVASAFVFLNLSVSSYFNTLIVNIITQSRLSWLGGRDLNKNKLDYYYYLIGGLALINFVYFITFARHFLVYDSVQSTVETKSIEESEDKKESTNTERNSSKESTNTEGNSSADNVSEKEETARHVTSSDEK